MTTYHYAEARSDRIDVQFVRVVQHIEMRAAGLDDLRLPKVISPVPSVVVASNCDHRCYRPERLEYRGRPHIARMKDQVATSERL